MKGVLKKAETEFHLLASFSGKADEYETTNDYYDSNGELSHRYYRHPSSCSLALCKPKTGRTHQIRRHAYAMGHPVLGDTLHGDSKKNRWWRENMGLNRLFLHCLSLDLPPLSHFALASDNDDSLDDDDGSIERKKDATIREERIRCVAPLPPELSGVLQRSKDMRQEIWDVAVRIEPRLALDPIDERGGSYGRNYKNERIVPPK